MTAIDCNGIASVTQAVGTWPVVLITAPMAQPGQNVDPDTYSVRNPRATPSAPLSLITGTVNQVQYRIDLAGSWYPMQHAAGTNYPHLWRALLECLRPGIRGTHHRGPGIHGLGRADGHREGECAGHPDAAKGGVASLMTGKYAKRSTNPGPTSSFFPGDSIVFRATIKDSSGQPVAGATASIVVTGPKGMTILTGPSDANGIADGIWKTSAPSRKSTRTPTGTYTGTVSGVTAGGYVWDAFRRPYDFHNTAK